MIPLAKPQLGSDELKAIERVLKSGWITQGPEVASFESEFTNYLSTSYASAVSSGTAALHLALKAVGVKPGQEVITVSYSFIATANAIRYCGAVPVFVDIDPMTQNMEPNQIESAISRKTAAILCVHQFGMPCDLQRIVEIAKIYRLPVVEDAACALGSEIKEHGKWRKIGSWGGDVACFSFHPRKILTTGEGGMVVTRSEEIYNKVRALRQHSLEEMNSSSILPNQTEGEYSELGFNYRMTDIQAAIGRVQLKRVPKILNSRRRLAERYQQKLQNLPKVRMIHDSDRTRTNWQSYPIILVDRNPVNLIMEKMASAKITVKGGILCAHNQTVYLSEPCLWEQLPQSEKMQKYSVLLPIYESMTNNEQDGVVKVIKDWSRGK